MTVPKLIGLSPVLQVVLDAAGRSPHFAYDFSQPIDRYSELLRPVLQLVNVLGVDLMFTFHRFPYVSLPQ
jgi:hypothetical protein